MVNIDPIQYNNCFKPDEKARTALFSLMKL